MLISVEKSKCKHLKDISYYNHNFYELPFHVEGYNFVEEIYDESWDTVIYVFGEYRNNKFTGFVQADSDCSMGMIKYLIAFSI